jgi:hypothetical protein
MAELQIDKTEIGLIMMALNSIDDAWLTEDGDAARARLAHKLLVAMREAARQDGAP